MRSIDTLDYYLEAKKNSRLWERKGFLSCASDKKKTTVSPAHCSIRSRKKAQSCSSPPRCNRRPPAPLHRPNQKARTDTRTQRCPPEIPNQSNVSGSGQCCCIGYTDRQ